MELQEREINLNKLLQSGMGNYQPQMNMFGSNVFSSIQTADGNPLLFMERRQSNDILSLSYQKSIVDNNPAIDIKN